MSSVNFVKLAVKFADKEAVGLKCKGNEYVSSQQLCGERTINKNHDCYYFHGKAKTCVNTGWSYFWYSESHSASSPRHDCGSLEAGGLSRAILENDFTQRGPYGIDGSLRRNRSIHEENVSEIFLLRDIVLSFRATMNHGVYGILLEI